MTPPRIRPINANVRRPRRFALAVRCCSSTGVCGVPSAASTDARSTVSAPLLDDGDSFAGSSLLATMVQLGTVQDVAPSHEALRYLTRGRPVTCAAGHRTG